MTAPTHTGERILTQAQENAQTLACVLDHLTRIEAQIAELARAEAARSQAADLRRLAFQAAAERLERSAAHIEQQIAQFLDPSMEIDGTLKQLRETYANVWRELQDLRRVSAGVLELTVGDPGREG